MVKYFSLQEGSKLSDFIGYHFITDDVSGYFLNYYLVFLVKFERKYKYKTKSCCFDKLKYKNDFISLFYYSFLKYKGSQYPIFKFSH